MNIISVRRAGAFLAVSLLCALGGCTTSFVRSGATPTPGTSSLPTVSSPYSQVINFGDSITCGYYATPANGTGYVYSTNGYAGQFDAALQIPAQNLCRPGDQAADMARLWVYPNATPALGANQLYTVLIGTNDANACGPSAGCLANYTQALTASMVWLALPAADKIFPSSMTATAGIWAPDLTIGLQTVGSGASLTFPVQSLADGRDIYFAYHVSDAPEFAAGSATVAIDGQPTAMLASAPSSHPIATQNGTTDTIFLAMLPLGKAGVHTVTVTTTSPPGSVFSLLWSGVSHGPYSSAQAAPVLVTGEVTTTSSATLNQTVATYNTIVDSLAAQLVADGLDVRVAPTASVLDPSTDLVDLAHPNTAGHQKLAQAYLSVQ